MIEVSHLNEKERLTVLPQEVQDTVCGILQVLDTEYGAERDKYKDLGGYVIVAEDAKDFDDIRKKANIDYDSIIPEYVDKIACCDGADYTNSLIICNSDYSISLIIPLSITPQNLINYVP